MGSHQLKKNHVLCLLMLRRWPSLIHAGFVRTETNEQLFTPSRNVATEFISVLIPVVNKSSIAQLGVLPRNDARLLSSRNCKRANPPCTYLSQNFKFYSFSFFENRSLKWSIFYSFRSLTEVEWPKIIFAQNSYEKKRIHPLYLKFFIFSLFSRFLSGCKMPFNQSMQQLYPKMRVTNAAHPSQLIQKIKRPN